MGDETEDRISGRRAVDDGARLLIAESSLKRVEGQYATLANGQDVLNGILIGRPQLDGTVTVGLVHKVEGIREKQDESDHKLDAVIADMGDLKSAQADQAQTLTEHGIALARIEKWFATGVGYLRESGLWLARGVIGALGLGALHLMTLWWPAISNFFTSLMPVAEAASKVH